MPESTPVAPDSPCGPIDRPDTSSRKAMQAALSGLPDGLSAGRMGDLAATAAAWQGQVPPREISQPRVVVFAGDHGIASRDISPLPEGFSQHTAEAIRSGGGPLQTMARSVGASIRVVDISIDHDAWGPERVSRSTPPIDVEDALDDESAARAFEIGQSIADQAIDSGADCLIPGNLSRGGECVAAAVTGALLRIEPVKLIGPGLSGDDELWKRQVSVVRDAMFRVRGETDVMKILQCIGSPDVIALVGFIGRAASRRTPVLLDGPSVTLAAFLAHRLCPGAREWFLAGQLTPHASHVQLLQELKLTPLLALEIDSNQGFGALAALPLLRAAIAVANENMPEV